MIIACPACSTRYVVPDTAIGVDGRTVRCAKCKHAWFQDGSSADDVIESQRAGAPAPQAASTPPTRKAPPDAAPRPDPARAPDGPTPDARIHAADATGGPPQAVSPDVRPRVSSPPPSEPAQGARPGAPDDRPDAPPASGRAGRMRDFDETPPPSFVDHREPDFYETPGGPVPAEPDDTAVSRFDRSPPFGPRRNTLRLWTYAALVFALVAAGAAFAIHRLGPPDWWPVQQPLFGAAQPDLSLAFPPDAQRWRQLENDSWMFTARIEIANNAREVRDLPPVLIVMLNEREEQIYSWVVEPPQSTLAPGESISIDEARTDVPRASVYADVGWAPL